MIDPIDLTWSAKSNRTYRDFPASVTIDSKLLGEIIFKFNSADAKRAYARAVYMAHVLQAIAENNYKFR